ncbi:hypothetical protein JCM8547_007192 [Rhodosporidiobolus lusitaniae]
MATSTVVQQQTQTQTRSDSSATSRRGRGRGRGRGGAQQGGQQGQAQAEGPIDGASQSSRGGAGGERGRGGRGRAGRAGRGGQARGGSDAPRGRRAQFGASLSSGNPSASHLHATAASFSPSSGISTLPPPAPVNQTLVERLTAELSSGEAECSICQDEISRTAKIHSCSQCSTPFHLACARQWAEASVATSSERAKLLTARDPRSPPPPEQLEGHWSCPNCNTQFRANQIPKKYTCFCGRFTDPSPPKAAGAIPHSCSRPCARKRPSGCKHPCSLSCHPGPCPPCPVVLSIPCHCSSRTLGVRCSALNDGKPDMPASLEAKEALKSCHQPHGALLDCGLHRCERECHAGPCGDCEEVREKKCFCGKETQEGLCGSTRRDERVEGCRMPSLTSDESTTPTWTGEFSCASTCSAPYSCGIHTCTSPCHPHLSSTPAPCPHSPSLVDYCPCGKTKLDDLPHPKRTKCTDKVPTCKEVCAKVREGCGHACTRGCHEGDCGTCTERVSLICRCGSTKTTRLCGEPYRSSSSSGASSSTSADGEIDLDGFDEFKCNRVCKSMRACGRHQCNRVCCPLAWQEALTTGPGAKKGKRRALSVQEEIAEMEAQDPLGLHRCDRTCGRKLNCGIHNCEMRDHKGPCPPCLRADFDEMICNCGSTVVLPPIPCNFVIDCRHPCIRPPQCGHPQLPHACHEDPVCPPCPYLTAKPCACGKKTIPNVRCSMDERKISCGIPCGKLLRCGFHRCKLTCHPSGECETNDTQICLKPRKHCGHPCPLACHFPSSCPAETPCDKLIDVTCACGHLSQKARCGSQDSKPEGNNGRLIKCTDACALAKRNQQLADALGVEKKEPKVREVQVEDGTLRYFEANRKWAEEIERQLTEFVKGGEKASLHFPAMKREQRQFVHELCELFEVRSEAVDPEPRRSIIAHRTPNMSIPSPTLSEALAASKKVSSATLNLGSLRRALPEKQLNNALYFEGVLGYDEEMLREILVPQMRGLSFQLTWVTDEDVLCSFDSAASTPPVELDTKLGSIASSLRSVISNTGFCVSVESVFLTDEGRVVRGGWTPVGGSASMSASSAAPSGGYQRDFRPPAPLRTANAFAFLAAGGGVTAPVRPATVPRNAWASGSLIGTAQHKPPRAVVAPAGEQERFIPSPLSSAIPSRVPTPSLQPPPPIAKDHAREDVPDEWDAELVDEEEGKKEDEESKGNEQE